MMVVTFHIQVSATSQFEYAWCLVRSRYPSDIRKGIILLEDLFQVRHCFLVTNEQQQIFLQNRDETNKRDYLYYLAIGNTKLKEYATALKYIRALLQVEPGNRQAQVIFFTNLILIRRKLRCSFS